jgi:hypothetical protein
MIAPSQEYEAVDWRFLLTKGDQLRLMDLIGNGLDHLGIDVVYSELKGVQVIEDRKMRGI